MPFSNDLSTLAAYAKELALDLLFPTSCVGCGAEETPLCNACMALIPSSEPQCVGCGLRNQDSRVCPACRKHLPALSRVISASAYDNIIVQEAIKRFKYFGERRLGESLAHLAAQKLDTHLALLPAATRERCMLIPVPLHPKRYRERGFSQSDILARCISQDTGIALTPAKTLVRTRYTPSQTTMQSRDARLENMQDAFAVRAPEAVAGKIIILVDDVATTAATLHEAARALRQAGAKSVWGLVVAHG